MARLQNNRNSLSVRMLDVTNHDKKIFLIALLKNNTPLNSYVFHNQNFLWQKKIKYTIEMD